MKIVVDTNIVFSALLKANSSIADIILSPTNELDFYAPELLKYELSIYAEKIRKYSKLSEAHLATAEEKILSRISLISEELLNDTSWQLAYEMIKDVDENDTPFVALSIDINAKLWTGDIKLINGISKKGQDFAWTTNRLMEFLGRQIV